MTRRQHFRNISLILLAGAAGSYWYLTSPDKAQVPIEDMQGPQPKLTTPRSEGFPTIKIPDVVGWQKNVMPIPAKGLQVQAFAQGLDHPRWVQVMPNGDVLVAESSAPARETKGLTDWIARKLMSKSNGGGASADRITLLRDADGDGVAEFKSVLIDGLHSPLGMALREDRLYIGNTDAVVSVPYKPGDTKITAKPEKLMDLPAEAPNGHWTRNVVIDPKGEFLYVTIGSNSNIGENKDVNPGFLNQIYQPKRAIIKQYEFKRKEETIFASGLRNPTGMDFDPVSGRLWTVVNERDMIGSDGPPDYLTFVSPGSFYGWPWFYWGQNSDTRIPPQREDLKQYSRRPDYALGPHVAALGLAFSRSAALGETFASGAFIGMHGSWNRVPVSGYKVAFVPFKPNGYPVDNAKPVDVLTGFLNKDGKAQGRPAGVAIAKDGALLVADDSGNSIWRVSKAN